MRKSFLLPLVLISLYSFSQTPNLVKDIYPGINSAFFNAPYYVGHTLNPINNGVVFTASSNGTLSQVYYSDGSNSGTYPLDPNLWCYGTISNKNYFNGKYYFSASTPSLGAEMFMTDGTLGGTKVLKDIIPGSGSGGGRILNITTNKIYYIASDGVTGNELYISDGTTPGTSFLKDMIPGVASPTVEFYNYTNTINDNFYFISTTPTNGTELWFTDGTTSGTKLVADIWPGTGNSIQPVSFKRLKGNSNDLFFVANNGVNGEELWFSNGTSVSLVKDIRPGSTGTYIKFLTYENNTLFFLADDGINGQELWRSDGTALGTYLLHDLTPGSNGSYPIFNKLNNKLYYYNMNSKTLWESDGTAIGTNSLNIPAAATYSSTNFTTSDFFKFNGSLYFAIHRFTGTSSKDSIFLYKLTTGLGSLSNFSILLNEKTITGGGCDIGSFDSITPLFFRYQYSSFGLTTQRVTYFSDGTSLNTSLCGYYAWAHTTNDCYEKEILSVNNSLLYWGNPTITGGPSVMYSNSIPTGSAQTIYTSVAYQICGPAGYFKQHKNHNNKIYFRGYTSGMGTELYETDGTPSGTSLVLDIYPGMNSALQPEVGTYMMCNDEFVTASSGGKFFFLANDGVTGTELWCVGGFSEINEFDLSTGFSMYPNPANNLVSLKLNEHFIGGNIQLFDAVGKQIQTQQIKNTSEKINLNLNSGVYFIKATTKDGISKTEKLVVE